MKTFKVNIEPPKKPELKSGMIIETEVGRRLVLSTSGVSSELVKPKFLYLNLKEMIITGSGEGVDDYGKIRIIGKLEF